MFEFLGALGDQNIIIFFAIFIIFTVLAYKLVKFLFKAFIIGLVAAMFPVVGNMVFGLSIDINLYNMVWFAVTAMGLFVLYSAVRMGWKAVRLALSPFRLLRRRKKPETREEKPVKSDKKAETSSDKTD
jgi:hypothetical protein